MEISLKLESMPTLCRPAFLPADTTITRRVAATIKVASSVVHRKEYCFRGIAYNKIITKYMLLEQRFNFLYSHTYLAVSCSMPVVSWKSSFFNFDMWLLSSSTVGL